MQEYLFVMANRADPDEMMYFVVSHLDLHCLEMFHLQVSRHK